MTGKLLTNIRDRLNSFVNELKTNYDESLKENDSKFIAATSAFLDTTAPVRHKISEKASDITNRVKESFKNAVSAIGDAYAKHEMTAACDANKYALAYQTGFDNLERFALSGKDIKSIEDSLGVNDKNYDVDDIFDSDNVDSKSLNY